MKPEISIITPVYNSERYLQKMINSVLNQSFRNWELIIIDDKSTDRSLDIIKDTNDNHIKPHINDILNQIKDYQTNFPDKNILIHCYMGSSRSASFVVAYLYKIHNMFIEDCISFIKKKRSLVNINTTFINDLKLWSHTN